MVLIGVDDFPSLLPAQSPKHYPFCVILSAAAAWVNSPFPVVTGSAVPR